MSPENLEIVKRILDEASDLPPAKRPGFLAGACAGDQALIQEVESLLAQENAEKRWSEGPILLPDSENDTAPRLQPDQRVGPYRVVRLLGEGGMGAVALAIREDDFEMRVALKVIRPGRVSSELLHRFHNERQILAQLEHPCIAGILDGGTTVEGHPFFAMEYVEGLPLDEYCVSRALPLRRRLELFLEICSALGVAHRNLIVHRDLKPRNILVTENGTPKLLDFGIAKRLESGGAGITGLLNPMTLKYASPEQVNGGLLATGTDIYSLGVVLYELLSGQHPHTALGDDTSEIVRAIREAEVPPPSTAVRDDLLRKRLAGDLDSIVLKATRKEPGQRYDSVDQLAEDVRRYLDGREVLARKGTRAYRAGKFIHRHKLALTAATVVFLVVLGLGSTAAVLWRRAAAQERIAVQETEQKDEVLHFMKNLFFTSAPDRAKGEELTAREILEQGEQSVEEATDDPLVKATILATIGEIYTQQGDYDRARAPWERAEDILRQAFPEGHPKLAVAINNLAATYYYASQYDQAEKLYREALTMKREFPEDDEIDVAKSTANLALIALSRGDYEGAEALYLEALEMRRQQHSGDDPTIARTLRSLGVLYYNWGAFEQAEPYLIKALEMRERMYDPENTKIATALISLGRLRQTQRRYREAEEMFARALAIRRQRFDEAHPHIAWNKLDLARLYLDLGALDVGEPLLSEALEFLRENRNAWEIAEAESVLGGYLTARNHFEKAEGHLLASYRILAEVRGERSIYARDAQRRLRQLYVAWGSRGGSRLMELKKIDAP